MSSGLSAVKAPESLCSVHLVDYSTSTRNRLRGPLLALLGASMAGHGTAHRLHAEALLRSHTFWASEDPVEEGDLL